MLTQQAAAAWLAHRSVGGLCPELRSAAAGNELGITSAREGALWLYPAHLCVASRAETLVMTWLRRCGYMAGGQGVAGSNPAVPTIFRTLLGPIGNQVGTIMDGCPATGPGRRPASAGRWRTAASEAFQSAPSAAISAVRDSGVDALPFRPCRAAFSAGVQSRYLARLETRLEAVWGTAARGR